MEIWECKICGYRAGKKAVYAKMGFSLFRSILSMFLGNRDEGLFGSQQSGSDDKMVDTACPKCDATDSWQVEMS
jgi:ribosomal protein L37AE/L43A